MCVSKWGGGFLSLRESYILSLSLLLCLEMFKSLWWVVVVVLVGGGAGAGWWLVVVVVETYFSVQLKFRPS